MEAFSITDIGEKRRVNQDYVFCEVNPVGQLPNLFIVADGMGGHNAGDYASRFCVEYFTQKIRSGKNSSPIPLIETSIKETNEVLRSKAEEKTELEGMGTTFVVATIFDRTMYVANIGDSRLYVIGKEIKQITEDHSLVEAMVKTGELNRDQARVHPNKNIITRALGANETVEPDFFEVSLEEKDIVLMCSDGLTNMLEDKLIEKIVRENDNPEIAAETLVREANKNGGKDNIAIIIISLKKR
ncbi:MAG TPA: Stp1/IreP family PP2C-type Ser/Thr phosphatase [Lachnospiraceae bacterium]|mgnify:CR=1 FL=1|nr:Stp1/IreP family PP2C-type Ser/Thr phosphatase [Lachnospiraceae bacterium]HBY71137.1 Stp1/IreP family PP2C-type Ser/Thr phosphatase [Lachnospiraceae bacterium]HCA68923.1 Stp1/IreP family PP2C-type Ser/Thr phosphatase [Lachnospiraceae bacterium]HCM11723.1 Stp1/IreP family PP2C-type Ser/Thr phosphatase [Lachnospiraceae bacterium]HCR40660.1 Stp1/IreP family PP2C-type Ser/Thr phosphatase [Lachnospiraceae bacterium]